jgi:hypothetical protein
MNRKEMLEELVTKVLDPEEPLFLLRGRDPIAVLCVLRWIYEAKELGVDKKKIADATDLAISMLAYTKTHSLDQRAI